MNWFVGLIPRIFLVAFASFPMIIQPLAAEAQTQNARLHGVRLFDREPPAQKPQVAMNAWTVGVAGGLLEGAPIRLAAEIARVVDDGPNLHVLPVVTRGVTENVNSLLYLRGIDAAIINSDALEEYKSQVPHSATACLHPESIPVRTSYVRSSRDSEFERSRRQESEL